MLDKIEPETRAYLKKIMNTLFLGLFWLFANVIAGIFLEFGFIENKLAVKNILFYTMSFVTLFFLIRYYIKIWGKS